MRYLAVELLEIFTKIANFVCGVLCCRLAITYRILCADMAA